MTFCVVHTVNNWYVLWNWDKAIVNLEMVFYPLIILSLLTFPLHSLQVMNFLKKMAGNEYVGFSNAT